MTTCTPDLGCYPKAYRMLSLSLIVYCCLESKCPFILARHSTCRHLAFWLWRLYHCICCINCYILSTHEVSEHAIFGADAHNLSPSPLHPLLPTLAPALYSSHLLPTLPPYAPPPPPSAPPRDFTLNFDPNDVSELPSRVDVVLLDISHLWRMQSELEKLQPFFVMYQQQRLQSSGSDHKSTLHLVHCGSLFCSS